MGDARSKILTSYRRYGARGYIDNRPLVWIILILAAIGGWNYLELTGVAPAGLWDRVPGLWKALLAVTVVVAVAGATALFIAGRVEERREPYRVEAQGDRRLIHEIAILERTLGAVLLAAGLVFLGFGIAGAGWFSWLVLALGLLLSLFSLAGVSVGRRIVVERGRLASEKALLGSWSRDWDRTWETGHPPRLEIREAEFGGGFGRTWFVPGAVLADGQEIAGSTRDARKLLPLLQQAIEETRA